MAQVLFVVIMSSLVESEHHFSKRCQEVGLTDPTCRALSTLGVSSLGRLAYAVGQPGQAVPSEEWDSFVNAHFGGITLGEQAALKRLLFESQTLVLSDLREQISHPDRWATRSVPPVERDKRMQLLKASLKGIIIQGPLEPAHSVLDQACRMEREGQLRYLPPEKCQTRMHEIQEGRITPSARIVEIEAGKLALKEERDLPEASCGSALLVQEALRRRGIALQFAGVCTYLEHERYVLKLFSHMAREPPPSCNRTSVAQVVAADRAVWTRLIEEGVSPKKDAAGNLPVDAALIPTLESYEVTIHLLPRMSSESATKKRQHSSAKQPAPPPKVHRTDAKGSKGSSKGKKGHRVPEGIRALGGSAAMPDSKRICFSRNLPGGCSENPCSKGAHVCALCYAYDHGIQDCPQRKRS